MDRKAAPRAKAARPAEARHTLAGARPTPPASAEAPRPAPRLPAASPSRRPEARPPPAPAGTPLNIELAEGEEEHGQFPRAQLAVRFEVWREREGQRQFSAILTSATVSVSGAFLESTFFLPVGTELRVRFALEEGAAPVEARAVIIREEREPVGRTGFGIRFVEFHGQTDVALARLFVGMRLRAFAEEYLQSRRARSLSGELERVVDALTAWELLKATRGGNDPWRGT